MTSVLNVDTIAAKDGTSPVGLTKQHAAKAWLYAQQRTSTVEAKNSFNVSTWVDDATGQSLTNFVNAMSNTNYNIMVSHNYASATKTGCSDALSVTSSQLKQKDYDYTGTSYDHDYVYNNVHGDLA